MTDIVEELRQASLNQGDYRWEAADEIERLRKDLSLVAWADNEHVKGLEKENERLRAQDEAIRSEFGGKRDGRPTIECLREAFNAKWSEEDTLFQATLEAEIERLRKDLSLAVFADNEYWQVLEKENERLRAALERIAFGKYHWEADAQEEARAALERK